MDVGRYIRRQLRLIIGPMVGLTLAGYFGFNLVEGDRGLLAWARLTHEMELTQNRASAVRQERNAAEHRVEMLQPQHMDRDLLDEQARSALNLVAPGEVVIMNSDGHPPK